MTDLYSAFRSEGTETLGMQGAYGLPLHFILDVL